MNPSKKLISKEQVVKVAKLANLKLTKAEVEKFESQLEEIIEYNINLLKDVNTEKVMSTVQVVDRNNVTREDEAEPGLSAEEALTNATEKHHDFFKVKAILEP